MSQDHAPAGRIDSAPTYQAGHDPGHGVSQASKNTRRTRRTPDAESSALLTLKEAASYLSVSYRTVRGWVEVGKLPAVRLPGDGRLVRVERAELVRLIGKCRS